jgi:small subunit ribosomal protein S1
MIEQEITVLLDEQDPFATKKVKVMVPKGTKILSKEPYTLEMLELYGINAEETVVTRQQESKGTKMGKGKIVDIEGDTALIDMGGKYTSYCQLKSEKREIREQLVIGMEVDLKYKKQGEGQIISSVSDAIDEIKEQEIIGAIGNTSVAFKGVVKELIHGGYWVDLSGITCFMPGSLAGMNKLWDFEAPVGKELLFMPINYAYDKQVVVVSHREYLKTLLPGKVMERRANLKEKVTGHVTGTTKFGIFAEFDQCLTGMIPKEDLVESADAYANREIKPGDQISFWVKDIIHDNKITLTQTGPVHNPWEGAEERYRPMSAHTGKVTKMTKYGAFVELEEGIVGLIHISGLKGQDLDMGESINVRVRSVSPLEQRVSLALAN